MAYTFDVNGKLPAHLSRDRGVPEALLRGGERVSQEGRAEARVLRAAPSTLSFLAGPSRQRRSLSISGRPRAEGTLDA